MNKPLNRRVLKRVATDIEDSRYTRIGAWDHCRRHWMAFTKDARKREDAALSVFCFLLNWGMGRNSFLPWCNYMAFVNVISWLREHTKDKSFEWSWEKNDPSAWSELAQRIEETASRLREQLEELAKLHPVKNGVTDTLISKLLFCTLACVPAYDSYAITGIRAHGLKPGIEPLKSKFTSQLMRFAFENMDALKERCDIPVVRLLDLYFWQFGYGNALRKRQ